VTNRPSERAVLGHFAAAVTITDRLGHWLAGAPLQDPLLNRYAAELTMAAVAAGDALLVRVGVILSFGPADG